MLADGISTVPPPGKGNAEPELSSVSTSGFA
jgi:hypothetical protein